MTLLLGDTISMIRDLLQRLLYLLESDRLAVEEKELFSRSLRQDMEDE